MDDAGDRHIAADHLAQILAAPIVRVHNSKYIIMYVERLAICMCVCVCMIKLVLLEAAMLPLPTLQPSGQ